MWPVRERVYVVLVRSLPAGLYIDSDLCDTLRYE
jgi:hypothetical protein